MATVSRYRRCPWRMASKVATSHTSLFAGLGQILRYFAMFAAVSMQSHWTRPCCALGLVKICEWTRSWHTSSTAQGGGGSFKNRKPIGEVGCCESGMAKRIHWWTERCLRSPLFLSLSLTIYLPTSLSSMYLSIYRSIYLSLSLFHLIAYLPTYLSTYLPIYLSTYLLSLSIYLSFICLSV